MASVRTALALLGAARSVVSRAVAAQADSLLAAPSTSTASAAAPVAPRQHVSGNSNSTSSTPWPSQQVSMPTEQHSARQHDPLHAPVAAEPVTVDATMPTLHTLAELREAQATSSSSEVDMQSPRTEANQSHFNDAHAASSTASAAPHAPPVPPSSTFELPSTVAAAAPAPPVSRQLDAVLASAQSSGSTTSPQPQAQAAEEYDAAIAPRAVPLRAARVPSSRIARALHYGGLGAGLAWGAAGTLFSGSAQQGSAVLGEANVRRLVDKLSTMRGAALKMGQFLSIQDSNMLPPQLEEVLLRVQNSAHYMPTWQLERAMSAELGADWRKSFDSFSDVPFASASIGQVHAAVLSSSHPSPLAGQRVAVKVQFPGVRDSIASDLGNLRWLLAASALLPRGLFLDNSIKVMQRELDDECDYLREAEMVRKFGALVQDSDVFAVPRVVDELSTAQVLTTEMMRGRPLTQASRFTQEKRNFIAKSILELSLRELFQYRLMQTDPNWTNFLYNERTGKIELIDFGAAREYDKPFIDDWLCILRAAIGGRRDECAKWSEKVGYLTGNESEAMRNAHIDSMVALGEPFRSDAPNPYPFAQQTITARVREQIPLMLRERLTPPPEQTYSLNRKLSGAFLLCTRLGAEIDCRTMLDEVTRGYVLDNASPSGSRGTSSNAASFGSTTRAYHTSSVARDASRQTPRRTRLNLSDRWPRNLLDAMYDDPALRKAGGEGEEELHETLDPEAVAASPAVATSAAAAADAPNGKTTLPDLMIRGVSVPQRPPPPGPEDCCMSGCINCVYNLYTDDLADFKQEALAARQALLALDPPLAPEQWPTEQLGARPVDAAAGAQDAAKRKNDAGEAARLAEMEVDAMIEGLDPVMSAFLAMERKMKRKQKAAATTT